MVGDRPHRCSFEKCLAPSVICVRWRYVKGNPRAWYCEEHFEMLGEGAVDVIADDRRAALSHD